MPVFQEKMCSWKVSKAIQDGKVELSKETLKENQAEMMIEMKDTMAHIEAQWKALAIDQPDPRAN